MKSRLVSAYQRGGKTELVSELLQADQEIIQVAFPYYMARAQDDDLIAAVKKISETIRVLAERGPGNMPPLALRFSDRKKTSTMSDTFLPLEKMDMLPCNND